MRKIAKQNKKKDKVKQKYSRVNNVVPGTGKRGRKRKRKAVVGKRI